VAAKRGAAISVLVVDDHRTFAEALAVAFRLEKDLAVQVVSTGTAAVAAVGRDRPDVVLMDLEMPGVGGVEAIRRLRQSNPSARVIVLSGHEEDLYKARAVEAGAIGYVSKFTPVDEIPDLVRKVHRGEPIMDRQETARLLRVLRRRRHQESTEHQRVNRLTDRQTEILQMIAEGVPLRDMATRLSLSPYTLRTHVQNILMRLAVHTKAEALAVAIRHGKISAGS
jgi:DNA-binding NarL/FixJ family response regulator